MNIGLAMLAVGAVLAASVAVALGAAKSGLPVLVAFLSLGMVLGSDGPGGVAFDDAKLAREVGVVSLVAILYEGGLSTSWRRLRKVVTPAVTLSTVGVVVTAGVTGAAAYGLFDLSSARSSPRPMPPPCSRRCATRACGAAPRVDSLQVLPTVLPLGVMAG